jgi:dolichol-phosphate mannosyltransferase
VDDACPDGSGDFVAQHCKDPRVKVLRNPTNLGVGGAVMHGYQVAAQEGIDVIIKIDGDGQMDPTLLMEFALPIIEGEADYTKGNRFFNLEDLHSMPPLRLFGNAMLSLLNKLSSGYWNLFDPTNGYTAISGDVAKLLPYEKISQRYFFESDMLFRLGTLRAVVLDVPMRAHYADEVSHLKISRILPEFFAKHLRNFCKRVFYNYYLRDMSLASLELPLGLLLLLFGTGYGAYHWIQAYFSGIATTAGTVMLSALPVLTGLQLILAFVGNDIASVPQRPLSRTLNKRLRLKSKAAFAISSGTLLP